MPKNRRYKTYPFPYLADFSKDYLKTKFDLEIGYKFEKGNILIKAGYSINNEEIVDSLKDNTLKVVLKMVCSSMGLSKTVPFKKDRNDMQLTLDSMSLDGEVDFTAYLIANDDFTLQNTDFSTFWQNESPVVKSGNVIGESNDRTLTITHMKSGSKKSIFKFMPDPKKEDSDPYSVILDDKDAIIFKLNKTMFRVFNNIKDKNKQYVYLAFIIPTISDILRQMININEDEYGEVVQNDFNIKHSSKRWYMVLQDNYMKAFNGIDPTNANEAINPLVAAQTIIDKYAVHNVLCSAKRLG